MMYYEKHFELCLEIAEKAHEGQTRYDGVTPYIVHPRAVADQFDDYFLKCIAILHDVIEDCDGYDWKTLVDLGVDPMVVDAVVVITHPKEEPYEEYIDRILPFDYVAKVKLADMLVNLADDPTATQKVKYLKYTPLLLKAV